MDIDEYLHRQQRCSDPVMLFISESLVLRTISIIVETILQDQGGQGPGAVW